MNSEYLYSAFPEIFLAAVSMLLLIFGGIRGDGKAHIVSYLAFLALLVPGIFVLQLSNVQMPAITALNIKASCYGCDTFNHMFVRDGFARFAKIIILAGAALSLVMSWPYLELENLEKPEYPVLVLLATVGMMLMVSAND